MTEVAHPQEGGTPGTGTRRRRSLIWGSEIPFRNQYFTGREDALQRLHTQLISHNTAVIRQPPEALYGLGGVGKTEIAAEYAHRYSGEYDVVWWIRADQEDSIRSALIGLGRRLGLRDFNPEDRDYSSRVVLDALQSGEPYEAWLLIFDNVTRPGIVSRYIPQGRGHVIVTSRISEWRQELRTDGIEVKEFDLAETVRFLRRRVPQLSYHAGRTSSLPVPGAEPLSGEEDARREATAQQLARTLGNLPIAAEHAAAYLTETGQPTQEYISDFNRNAHELLSQPADMYSAEIVSTTWSLSRATLTPEARALFQVLAFISAEPISEDVLVRPTVAADLSGALAKVLGSRAELRRAGRELARFSLAKVHGLRNVIQLHNVVQAVTRGRIEREDPSTAAMLRDIVHSLLAAADPGEPEKEQNDPLYERTIHHVVPSGALETSNPLVRHLIIDQVRRLHLRGGNEESLSLGEQAMRIWTEQFGSDDILSLALAVQVGIAQRACGRVDEAYALNSRTMQALRALGEDDETYLACAMSHGQDLRLLGRYDEALANDLDLLPAYEQMFGPGTFRPLMVNNNIAIDLRCVGKFPEALIRDQETYAACEQNFGYADRRTLSSKFGIARDLRRLGRYEEGLVLSRELAEIVEARAERWQLFRLSVYEELGQALRRTGYYVEACDLAEDTYRRYQSFAGDEHRETLVAATNLINHRRVTDSLAGAQKLGEQTVALWEKAAGHGHPNTLAARANLAVVLRRRGAISSAADVNETALTGFRQLFSYDHPSTLVVMSNLASDRAAAGDTQTAREFGEQAFAASQRLLGDQHPITLGIGTNLSLDLRATGDEDHARVLHASMLKGYKALLTDEHPHTRRAAEHGRIDLDLEPMSP